jgi:hypothetical protein
VTGLGYSEFARHYYRNRGFFLFLQVLRWFTSLSSLVPAYVFSGPSGGFAAGGFPIRKSSDITPVCGSPKLIAACHVLLRLFLPRHPPCALSSLTIELTLAQELVHPPNLNKREERGSSRSSSIAFNRRHVSSMFNWEPDQRWLPNPASRTYPKDTQLNNLLYSGIRIQAQGAAQPCNLFTQSISLSNIQSPAFAGAHPQVDRTSWRVSSQRSRLTTQPCSKIVIQAYFSIWVTSFGQTLSGNCGNLVELRRIELLTPCLQSRCSPS